MQVAELAKDLKVEADVLLHLLRTMGIKASDESATVSDAEVSKVLAKVEREKRSGKKDAAEAIQAALEEAAASTSTRRRRRRRRSSSAEDEAEDASDSDEDEDSDDESDDEPEAEADSDDSEDSDDADEAEDDEADEPVAESDDEDEEYEEEDDEDDEDESDDEPEAEADEPEDDEADDEDEEEDDDEDEDEDEDEPEDEAEADEPEAAADEASDEKPKSTLKSARAADEEDGKGGTKRRFKKPAPAASAGPGGTVRIQAEGYTSDGRRQGKGKKGKKRGRVDQDAVQDNLNRVMNELKGGGGKKKRRRRSRPSKEEQEFEQLVQEEEREREHKTIKVNEFLSVAELAELMDVTASAIITAAFKNLGLGVTINQRLEFDQIELLVDEFGFTAEQEEEYAGEVEEEEDIDPPESLKPRPPVVTVMGHVDHGKTLLLDQIRRTNVVAGEAGGITQHIGAYHVELDDGRMVSFLDTPGHAAFTAMRARGADVTDIVILLVAADDSVMPQTIEAISHAKSAGVPMIVAINKCDLPAANPDRVKQELLQHDVQVEDYGGTVLASEVSAKKGTGIEDLLEKVLLQAELLELKANPDRAAVAAVIEAQLDVGKGAVTTVMVEKGTLRVGDSFVVGMHDGRVRALLDERGKKVDNIGPGIPAQVLGSSGVPQAGDSLQVMDADRAAEIAQTRQRLDREKKLRVRDRGMKLGDFSQLMAEGEAAGQLPLIIKGDVDGSVQAVSDALEQLSTDEVQVEIVHRGVGAVNESDVLLAETTGAVIIGFRVRPDAKTRQQAESSGVDIQTYDVIYNAVDDIRDALEGMLSPEQREEILGSAEVRETFRVSKVGMIAGCYVTDGIIDRKGEARLIRDGIVQYEGNLSSLKRFKDDVKEVREGFECGIGIENFNDIKVGDVIECYRVEEIQRKLESAEARG